MPRLHSLGLRAIFVCALVAAWLGARAVKPPKHLLAAFDAAIAAVEHQIAEIEERAAAAEPPTFDTRLAAVETAVERAHEAATARLEQVLASITDRLSERRRAAVLACIDHHRAATLLALARAADPELRAEHERTHARLLEIRRRI